MYVIAGPSGGCPTPDGSRTPSKADKQQPIFGLLGSGRPRAQSLAARHALLERLIGLFLLVKASSRYPRVDYPTALLADERVTRLVAATLFLTAGTVSLAFHGSG